MEKEGKTKSKLLYLLKIFKEESDEDHKLSMKDIIEKLKKYDIKAERKSISRDIKLLQDLDYDIVSYENNREGYFMDSREFEVSELRLLIDAVLSAKFISLKQSKTLVDKLKALTSKGLVKKLENQLYIDERIKTNNDHVCEVVDKINDAISQNKKISFKYHSYTLDKKYVAKREGKPYIRSPYSLAWNDDKYYLICGDDKYDDLSHFRVDHMSQVIKLEEPRRNFSEVSEYKNSFDTADYLNGVFNMFTGEKEFILIKLHKDLINLAIERFGEEVSLRNLKGDFFEIGVQVRVSDGFIAWIMQLGTKAEIVHPLNLRVKMKEIIEVMNRIY